MAGWMHSITAKVLGVGALALVMLVPLVSIHSMVGERQDLNKQAASNVAKGSGSCAPRAGTRRGGATPDC